MQRSMDTLAQVAGRLGTTAEQAAERLDTLQEELNASKKQIAQLRRDLARYRFEQLMTLLKEHNGVPTLVGQVSDVPLDTLREMSDWFRDKVKSGVLVLGSVVDNKPQLVVTVSDDLTKKGLHAGNLVKQLAAIVGGGGGGRPNMAQAGGKDSEKLPAALDAAPQFIIDSYKP
jgi:alanyl-tRNA synthetase